MTHDEHFDLEAYLKNQKNIEQEFVRTELDKNNELELVFSPEEESLPPRRKGLYIPEYHSRLRSRIVEMPEEIYQASGIKIFGKRIKSIMFTTDVAIIRNSDAQSIIAVYPFTPQYAIMQSIVNVASVPVFLGVGGGTTSGQRSINIAFHAEQLGAYGVVVTAPMKNEVIAEMNRVIEIPLIATIASSKDDYIGKLNAGADMLNVSAGAQTADLVKLIRSEVGNVVPIIATGGPGGESIRQTIAAGANAITYTPPTSGEIFAKVMDNYRN